MSDKLDGTAATMGYLLLIVMGISFIVAALAAGVIAVGYAFVLMDVPWYVNVSMAATGLFTLWRMFLSIVRSSRKDKK